MGEMGRKIVGLDIDDLLNDLRVAYANEWLAHYYYSAGAHLVSGINGEFLSQMMRTGATEELGHADRIAERMAALGGEPPSGLAEIAELATVPKLEVPAKRSDHEAWLRSVLEVERHVIGEYQALTEKTRHTDPVTHELAEELLAAEVAEEEELENLLG